MRPLPTLRRRRRTDNPLAERQRSARIRQEQAEATRGNAHRRGELCAGSTWLAERSQFNAQLHAVRTTAYKQLSVKALLLVENNWSAAWERVSSVAPSRWRLIIVATSLLACLSAPMLSKGPYGDLGGDTDHLR